MSSILLLIFYILLLEVFKDKEKGIKIPTWKDKIKKKEIKKGSFPEL